ncbi:MAG: serine/threonine-protein phosphatase [Bdellovibrionales bacterium]|nr:serine/threonine-protein phosphatase [Bdellovibrionales bacterium]
MTAQLEAFLLSDIGRRRAQNQDSGGSFPEIGLFVVADGMGGHRGGEVASKIAVDTIHEVAATNLKHGKSSAEALTEGAKHANLRIMDRAKKEPDLEGMGTTTTSLRFEDGKVFIGHVGDSRCYLLKREGIWQLTRDHSLVQEKLRAGMITREQLKTDRMKNVITRSVGFDLHFGIDVYEYAPEAGDLFLLCSDGLTGPLEDADIHEIATRIYYAAIDTDEFKGREHGFEPLLKSLAESLVAAANDRGGDDNITALIARYPGKSP